MQYMLLVYETQQWPDLPEAEKSQVQADCGAWHQELVKSGHARAAVGLHPVSTAVTVRQKNGKPKVTDGPFAETREVLGGYEIIECTSMKRSRSPVVSPPSASAFRWRCGACGSEPRRPPSARIRSHHLSDPRSVASSGTG